MYIWIQTYIYWKEVEIFLPHLNWKCKALKLGLGMFIPSTRQLGSAYCLLSPCIPPSFYAYKNHWNHPRSHTQQLYCELKPFPKKQFKCAFVLFSKNLKFKLIKLWTKNKTYCFFDQFWWMKQVNNPVKSSCSIPHRTLSQKGRPGEQPTIGSPLIYLEASPTSRFRAASSSRVMQQLLGMVYERK